ncbi:MAG: urate hydroxylase PuuD, partial [Caenispirillum sp.]|nr:urate hydroxylase PuuD [Caenispirillum sp.]
MDLALMDWLNLIGRWIHLIVGIAWIGSSFYFVWQDNSLEATADDPERKRLHGEIWMVHGGGFYHAKKYKVAPPGLPEHLHWFKWEAYSTWLSGMALLVIVYYLTGAAAMLPPGSAL